MSNGSDPNAIVDGIAAAEDAFENRGFGQPAWEPGIDTDDEWQTQLTKACKLLSAIETLEEEGEYYTAIVEISFGTIERSVEAYCLNLSDDSIEAFTDHTEAYERAESLGLFDDVADGLIGLYSDNRTESYYGSRRSTEEQAAAMHELAIAVHEFVNDQLRDSGVCIC